MRVEVRLFASLREKLPDAPRGRAPLDLPEGATLQDLLDTLDIEPRLAQMVLVNGEQQPRPRAVRASRPHSPGDTIAIFPPLAGG